MPSQSDASTTAVQSRFNDGAYLARNPQWHEGDAAWKAQQVVDMLERHQLRPRSICDVGCGTGAVLEHLRAALPADVKLVGFEPSDAARAISHAGVPIRPGSLPPPEERFDVMLLLDVFEHVEDYIGFLREASGRADRFIFHIPLDLSVQTVLRMTPLLSTRAKVGHLHYFSRETARATLADAGFVVVDADFTRGGIELPTLGRKQRLAALPRRAMARVSPALAARVLGGFSLLVLAVPSAPAGDGPAGA